MKESLPLLKMLYSNPQIVWNCSMRYFEATFKGQLGVPLAVYPWYLLCSLGILGDYNFITHKYPLYRAWKGISHRGVLVGVHPTIPWNVFSPYRGTVIPRNWAKVATVLCRCHRSSQVFATETLPFHGQSLAIGNAASRFFDMFTCIKDSWANPVLSALFSMLKISSIPSHDSTWLNPAGGSSSQCIHASCSSCQHVAATCKPGAEGPFFE